MRNHAAFFVCGYRFAVESAFRNLSVLPETPLLRYLFWLCQFVFFFALLGFSLKNSDPVAVSFFLGYQWQAPLVLVLLVFFVSGVTLGLVACLTYVLRLRRELLLLRKEMRSKPSGPSSDQLDAVI